MKKLVMGILAGLVTACGGGGDVVVPDAIDAFVHCNPLDQTGCELGEKCTWVIDQEQPRVGHIDCAPDGTVAANGVCAYGPAGPMGYDNCVKGTACSSGECKVLCDQNEVSPLCPANYSCGLYENFFDSGGMTVAGVCDSNCDPLNQNTLATNAVACGAIDPKNPDKGCYTSNGYRQFTCAPANNSPDPNLSVLHRVDDVQAAGDAAGRPYPNGCAPGYQGVFFEGPTMMVTKCTGLCAPRDSDAKLANSNGAETVHASGLPTATAKLVTAAAPAAGNAVCKVNKKGSIQPAPPAAGGKGDGTTQNCRYLWRYLLAMDGKPSTSQYNDTLGVCYNFKEWTWDDDANAMTPEVQEPSCTSLPESTATNGGQSKGAASWACYSLAKTLTLPVMKRDGKLVPNDGKVQLPPSERNLRVMYDQGELVRHSYH